MKKIFLLIMIVSAGLLSSCVTVGREYFNPDEDFHREAFLPEDEYKFEAVNESGSIMYAYYENKKFPVKYHIVKADLTSQDISLILFPEQIPDDSYFKSMRTVDFARKNNCIAAVNLSPFENIPNLFGFKSFFYSTKKIIGLHKVEGKILSSPMERYCAFAYKTITDEKGNQHIKAAIFSSQFSEKLENYTHAFGGFFIILKKGKVQNFYTASHDSRVALGLDAEKKTLYILAVEGEKPRESSGLTYPECAQIFLKLNVSDAMQVDGGASTQLVIKGKNKTPAPYTPIQGNHLGIVAK